jgi:hypothetical protein
MDFKGETKEGIYVVFDHNDSYIHLFELQDIHYEKNPTIIESAKNNKFVSMMAHLL